MADFAARYGPWALIAGGSEGIGASYARLIAERGVNVALFARHEEPLDELTAQVRATTGVQVRSAPVDLTSPSLIEDLAGLVAGIDVGLLVYNAGAVHGASFFVDRPLDDALHLVYLSCRGPVLLAHHFGAAMAARGRGGIILMTSLGAAAGSAYTAVYNATKAFDLVLAESLWMELGQRGVDVLGVPAGLTDTPAMRRSGVRVDDSPFIPMTADAVAEEALSALGGGGPVHVVGDQNREAAASLWPFPRAGLIAGMSAGAASLYGLPVPPTPG
jgi:short-subunit dehydrogenase